MVIIHRALIYSEFMYYSYNQRSAMDLMLKGLIQREIFHLIVIRNFFLHLIQAEAVSFKAWHAGDFKIESFFKGEMNNLLMFIFLLSLIPFKPRCFSICVQRYWWDTDQVLFKINSLGSIYIFCLRVENYCILFYIAFYNILFENEWDTT